MKHAILLVGLVLNFLPIAMRGQVPDTVLTGDVSLRADLLAVGVDSVRIRWIRDGAIANGPLQVEELTHDVVEGRRILRQVMTVHAAQGIVADTSSFLLPGLEPLGHRSHSWLRTLQVDYDAGRVRVVSSPEGGESRSLDSQLETGVFDPSSALLVIRALPLVDGYSARVPMFNHEQLAVVWATADVVRRSRVRRGDVVVSAWEVRVDHGGGNPPATYWVDPTDRAIVAVSAPIADGLVMFASAASDGEGVPRWIDDGLRAMGGEGPLAALHSMRIETIGHTNLIEQSERPDGPWISLYTQGSELQDRRSGSIRRTTSTRWVQSPDWSREITLIGDAEVAAYAIAGRVVPAGSGERAELLAWRYSADRVLLNAGEAGDATFGVDTTMQGVPHREIRFTLAGRPVSVFLNVDTRLPSAVRWTDPWIHGLGSVWGEPEVTALYSLWTRQDALTLPLQRDLLFEGRPWKQETIVRLEFDAPAPADSFDVSETVRQAFVSRENASLRTMRFGEGRGTVEEPVELPGGGVLFPGAWNVAAIPQEGGVIVIEAPISSEYTSQAIESVRVRYPDLPIQGVVSTSDAWPHIGGVREYVARQIPVYGLDQNGPVLEALVRARYRRTPDSLERARAAIGAAPFRLATDNLTIGDGPSRIELYPVRGESGERMMLAYVPAQRLLYASDLIQPAREGGFFWPEYLAEVVAVVDREGLQVDTVFAMHLSPTPWQDVLDALTPPGREP